MLACPASTAASWLNSRGSIVPPCLSCSSPATPPTPRSAPVSWAPECAWSASRSPWPTSRGRCARSSRERGAPREAILSRGQKPASRLARVLLEHLVGGIDLAQQHVVTPEIGQMLQDASGVGFSEQAAVDHRMLQDQAAVARQVDIDDLDAGLAPADIVPPGQFAADPAVAALVLDGLDADALGAGGIVLQLEHP